MTKKESNKRQNSYTNSVVFLWIFLDKIRVSRYNIERYKNFSMDSNIQAEWSDKIEHTTLVCRKEKGL